MFIRRRSSWRKFGSRASSRSKLSVLRDSSSGAVSCTRETVRRQSFWDRERLKIRESLARLVCNVMRLADVQQAAVGDCLSFDPFSFDQNGLALSEVDVGWRQIADAFVMAQVIVVNDEGRDLGFEIARQVIGYGS
jgi:hypothetical protein